MEKRNTELIVVACGFLGFFILMAFMYSVWQKGLSGKANLERAKQERQILVEQAKAEKEASSIRAEAIKIIGQAAQDYPEYRKQEFMGAFAEALQNESIEKIIFVPTEANVPIVQIRDDTFKN